MYQMTTITDYIAHSIISLNKKKKRKRRFMYFVSMSDTTTNYDCIVTIVYMRTHSLLLLLYRLPPVNIGLVARERNKELSH
jgi:hypothetical protein